MREMTYSHDIKRGPRTLLLPTAAYGTNCTLEVKPLTTKSQFVQILYFILVNHTVLNNCSLDLLRDFKDY